MLKSICEKLYNKKNVCVFLIIITFIHLVFALIGAITYYNPVPMNDDWRGIFGFLKNFIDGDFISLFSQHNVHRIIVSRIFFLINYFLFNGSSIFLIILNYILALLNFIIFYFFFKEITKTHNLRGFPNLDFIKVLATTTILILCFSFRQIESFEWAFQSQFFLAYSLPLLTFFLIHKTHQSKSRKNKFFILSCFTSFLSAGTMANGIATLPLASFLIFILGLGWKKVLFSISLSTLIIFAYFYDYSSFPNNHASILDSLTNNTFNMGVYFILFLANPLKILIFDGIVAVVFAILLIILSTLFFIKYIKYPTKYSIELALLTFVIYVLITAFVISGSRVNLGIWQAFAGRYSTPVLMMYLSLFIISTPYLLKLLDKSFNRYVWVCLILPSIFFINQFTIFNSNADRIFNAKVAALSLELGIEDDFQIHTKAHIYPHIDTDMVKMADFVVKNDLSIFNSKLFKNINESIGTKVNSINKNYQCVSEIKEIIPIIGNKDYLKIIGNVKHPNFNKKINSIYILNEQNIIGGYALVNKRNSEFVGYVKASFINSNLHFLSQRFDCYSDALPFNMYKKNE